MTNGIALDQYEQKLLSLFSDDPMVERFERRAT